MSGKRLPDGSYATRLTAQYPASVASAIASALAPALTSVVGLVPYHTWQNLLPASPPRPPKVPRADDGAGFCSRACWSTPLAPNRLAPLRKLWLERIMDTKAHASIAQHLISGSKEPPLSESDLQPYLSDLRTFLGNVADPRLGLRSLRPSRSAFSHAPLEAAHGGHRRP